MGIDISQLGDKAKAQVLQKLVQQQKPKPKERKYHNQPVQVDGIRFDSQKEAQRYRELMLLSKSQAIGDLKLQPEFTLQEAYTTPDGERVRAIRYRADFSYKRAGDLVVEDVKSTGTETDKYKIKKKLLLDRFGIKIVEVM